jgi:hypothetical protein
MPAFGLRERLQAPQTGQGSVKAIPGAIPAICSDELLASYWRRLVNLNGIGQSRTFATRNIGGPWRELAVALPMHLNEFWRNCGHWLRLSMAHGIERHTLFPVFACCLPDVRRDHLRLRMQASGLGPRRPSLPLLPGDHLPYIVSICELCARDEEQTLGFSYWHREHNCPGVCFCRTHSKRLIQFSTKSDYQSSLAIGDAGKYETENDRRLCGAYAKLLLLTGDGLASFRADLKERALQVSHRTSAKRIDISRVAERIMGRFAGGFAAEFLSSHVLNERLVREAVAHTFSSRPAIHPLWVALLHESLPPLSTQPRAPEPSKKKSMGDEQTLLPALLAAKSLTQASQSLGISVTTLATVARRNSISFKARPSKVDLGMRAEIEKALAAGKAIPEIAAHFGLGVSSVYRALASQPTILRKREASILAVALEEHRSRWQRLLSEHDSIMSSKVRRKAPALWTWLYRNDREWLQRSMSPVHSREMVSTTRRPRTRLSSDDRQQFSKVLVEAIDAKNTVGLKPRLSRSRVAHSIGFHDAAQLERCLSEHLSGPAFESVKAYVHRRLWTAMDSILQSSITLRGWRLLRVSRLRPQTLVTANIDLNSYIEQVMHGASMPTGGYE